MTYLFEINNTRLARNQSGGGFFLDIPRLTIGKGERVAIVGPSGCGKSTTLDLLGMSLRPTAAESFNFSPEKEPIDVAKLWQQGKLDTMALLRRKHMGYILQTGELLPALNVRENIALPAHLKGQSHQEIDARIKELGSVLGIEKLLHKHSSQLSIGERQRVAIARALASNPEVVLADEPTASLDPERARDVMRLFVEMLESYGTTLIVVSHDWQLVDRFNFRKLVIDLNRVPEGVKATLGR